MLESLRAWLNGNREYFTGVALLKQLTPSHILLPLLQKGKSDFAYKRLQDELMKLCLEMKTASVIIKSADVVVKPIAQDPIPVAPVNTSLYEACLNEANLLYKEMMNERALLFASAKVQGYEDINRPDLVQQRSKPAVDLVVKYQRVSKLYDRADYVKKHGRLPAFVSEENDVDEYDALPDHLVKQTLDNLRKNTNKLKKREQTAERIALIQKHEANIKKLETKWHSLKPQQ
jgi:hypothetical protein